MDSYYFLSTFLMFIARSVNSTATWFMFYQPKPPKSLNKKNTK
ncbi:MAG: cyclic lactone autoinducer peptide [Clostridia bacterium]|nr:cyclic lactone autoinducer peptide [Clostridia bacterium]